MGVELREMGTSTQYLPVMKRATATLSTGRAVAVVADANLAAYAADDSTGVAKIHIYKATNTQRDVFHLALSTTPTTPPCSSTIAAVMGLAVDYNDDLHVVFAGTDNSLRYIKFTESGDTWTAGAQQTIVAANAVTRRFRAVDIDVSNSGGSITNPIVIYYEALASSGAGARVRAVYQKNDGTTWVQGFSHSLHATRFILEGSEDVAISYNTVGPVANLANVMMAWTHNDTVEDWADSVTVYQFDVNSAVTDNAVHQGTWPYFNGNIAAGSRRIWIWKCTTTVWQVAMVCGTSNPRFQVMRLTYGSYSAPIVNQSTLAFTGGTLNAAAYKNTANIDRSANKMTAVACSYSDNKVMFGFISRTSPSYSSSQGWQSLGAMIFGYEDSTDFTTVYHDTTMRPLDDWYRYGEQPTGVYGFANHRTQAGDYTINFVATYGYPSAVAASTSKTILRYIENNSIDAPVNTGPSGISPTNRPTLRAQVLNTQLYPNVNGKLQWQLDVDAGFATDLRIITQADAKFRDFGSRTQTSSPPVQVSHALTAAQALYSGTWYMRSLVITDAGNVSDWSDITTFQVYHRPVALPMTPQAGSSVPFGVGDIIFAWRFSDTEPTDSQTAYRLMIDRVDTGANVYDSGKVSSSDLTVTQTISSSLKNLPLQWKIALWDEDDMEGSFSNPVLFTLVDAPAVVMTSPVSGATVTSAMPTVTWSPTFGNDYTQKGFNVLISPLDNYDDMSVVVAPGGWGNTKDSFGGSGLPWTVQSGTAAYFQKDGTDGLIDVNALNAIQMVDSAVNVTNAKIQTAVSLEAVLTGASAYVDLIFRSQGTSDYSFARFTFGLLGVASIRGGKRVAGVETLATDYTVPGFTYLAATKYTLEAQLIGATLYAKIYAVTDAAPAYWHIQNSTVGYPVTAGSTGVAVKLESGVTNVLPFTFKFDNFGSWDTTTLDPEASLFAASGWLSGTSASYTFPTNVMENNTPYLVRVQVKDTGNMYGRVDTMVYSDWTEPLLGDIALTSDEYSVTISWTNANQDADFVAWRVYRRYMVPAIVELDDLNTLNTWVLIHENTESDATYEYQDYLVPLNKECEYVVVQLADRFGSLVESVIDSFETVTVTGDRYYFVPSVPIGSIASYEAVNVVGDSYTDEIEQEVLHVIGRGRQVQVGDDLGAVGTLVIHLRKYEVQSGDLQFLQRLASSRTINVYMKTPFGHVFYLKFGSIPVSRLGGVGLAEMVDLQVPYTQVYGDVPVTRLDG